MRAEGGVNGIVRIVQVTSTNYADNSINTPLGIHASSKYGVYMTSSRTNSVAHFVYDVRLVLPHCYYPHI